MKENFIQSPGNPNNQDAVINQISINEASARIENGILMIGNKTLQILLDELEKRLDEKRLKLIYELEDTLNVTLSKNQ